MAKARKKSRKSAAKRSAKKSKRAAKAMAKSRTKPKARKTKARRARAPKEGPIAGAVHVVTDTIREAAELRRRMEGRESFED